MKTDYAKLLEKGYEWVVIAAYDGPYGQKNDVLSKHRTYQAAEKSAKRHARGEAGNWIAVRDTRSYA